MKQMIKKLAIVLSVALVCAPMGAMAANKLIVKDATGTIDKMVVTDSGYVGVGTNAPGAALNIAGPPGSVAARIVVQTLGTSAAGGGGFLGLHNNGTETTPLMPSAGDRLGFHLFGSKNGAANVAGGGFFAMAEGNWTAGTSYPTYFTFVTAAPGSTVLNERLRVTANGNIGIGVTAPTQKLQVNGGVRIYTADPKPLCNNTSGPLTDRGTLWFTRAATGKDSLEVCATDGTNYAWRSIY